MALPIRPGMTVPLPGPLHSHRDKLAELADLGYTDIWSAESDGADAFTPLALAAAWEPRLRLGTAIVPAYTRSPACFAQWWRRWPTPRRADSRSASARAAT